MMNNQDLYNFLYLQQESLTWHFVDVLYSRRAKITYKRKPASQGDKWEKSKYKKENARVVTISQ